MNAPVLTSFAAVAWPLLLAVALAIPRARGFVKRLAAWAALPALIVSLPLPGLAENGAPLSLDWLFLGSELGLDATGRIFLLFSSLVWLLAGLTVGPLVAGEGRDRFWLFFLLSMAGNLGLILARDAVSFYTLFALMSFSAYGMIRHPRDQRSARAASVYVCLVIFGELLLIAGLVLAAGASDSLLLADIRSALPIAPWRETIMAALLLAFGIKAGLILVHISLPLIYSASPLPAAIALAGAMLNAGVLGWLRFLPLGEAQMPGWSALLIALGLAGAFYAAVVGIMQRDARALLGYSSISQVGLMLLGIGAGLALPALWPTLLAAITFFALHHALSKASLFLGLAVVSGRARRWVLAGMALASLALAGAPLTSGMPAKAAFKEQLSQADGGWIELAYLLLPWSSVATALLMLRFLWLAAAGPAPESTPRLTLLWAIALGASVALPWLLLPGPPVVDVQHLWSLKSLFGGTWPVLLALSLALVAFLIFRRTGLRPPVLPAGDVLVPMAASVRVVLGLAARVTAAITRARNRALYILRRLKVLARTRGGALLDDAESFLGRWRVAMTLALVLALAIAALGSL